LLEIVEILVSRKKIELNPKQYRELTKKPA